MSSSNLTPWLKKLVDAQSKGRVEFKTSPAGFGLGGFALCDFKSGDIVFFESTVYPGVTNQLIKNILEKKSKLKSKRSP